MKFQTFLLLVLLTVSAARAGELRGVITDAEDGQPLPGVNVYLKGTARGATTDTSGSYRIDHISSGTYQLTFQFVGYRTQVLTIAVRESTTCNTALKPDVLSLSEIVVTPGRFSVLQQDPVVPQTLSREEIQSMPQFGDDIYRAISRLPGVTSSDFSSRFSIRGGDHDQVLATLDGLELIDPFHMKDVEGGGLSIVDSDVIGGIDMIAGGFPADYGNKRSAVMEMQSVQPASNRRFNVGLGLANARIFGEGGSETLGWLFSARRGYVDFVLKLMGEDDNFRPVYYDFFGKLTRRINDENRLSINVLWANDDLAYRDEEEEDYEFFSQYGNTYAWLVWDATFSSKLHARTLPYISRFTTNRSGSTYLDPGFTNLAESVDDTRTSVRYGLKSDWTFQPHRKHLLRFGLDLQKQRTDYDYFRREGFFFLRDTVQVALSPATTNFSAYITDKWRIIGPLIADLGIRLDHHSLTDETNISPRAAMALPIGQHTVLRAAWGHYYQAPGTSDLQIQFDQYAFRTSERATHYILGLEQQLPHGAQLRIEGYLKDLDRLHDRYEDVANEIELMPELHSDIAHLYPESGIIRGLEIYLKRDTGGRFNWWTSYTWSKARETHSATQGLPELQGRTFPQKRDQRHQFALDIIFRPSPKWNISAAWQYRSGWPHTARHIVQTQDSRGNPYNILDYVDLYDDRYPAYHRLDIKLNRQFTFSTWRLNTSIGVINLYNRHNVRSYYYRLTNNRTTREQFSEHWFPRLPSFTLSAEF